METWVRERLLDIAARELGIGRDEIRLRNMIGADELPRRMLTGPTLDVRMSARTTLERALEVADLEHWPATADRGARRGAHPRPRVRHVHRGRARTARLPGGGDAGGRRDDGGEPARAVLEADGTVSVYTQQMPHGQGHETTLAQVAADELGVPLEQVRVRYGDTSITPFGSAGTGGSRSAPMAGGAVTYSARALRGRIARASPPTCSRHRQEDLVIDDGAIHVQGVPAIVGVVRRRRRARPGEPLRDERRSTTAARAAGRRRRTCAGSRST